MKTMAWAAAAAIVAAAATPATAAELVSNGGFEQGIAGWDTNFLTMNATSFAAHTGTQSASTGCGYVECLAYNTGAYIRQTLTAPLGSLFTLTMYVAEQGATTSGLRVYWNGVQVYDVTNPASNSLTSYNAATGRYEGSWNKITVANLPGTTITGVNRTELEMHAYKTFGSGMIYVDDISVTNAASTPAAVPEPATWAMMVAGFGLVGAGLRRRRRAALPA